MRRPDFDEQWSDSGLVCWIDPASNFSRENTLYISWPQVLSIRKHIENNGSIHDCPIKVDRWAFSKILIDMIGDGTE